MQVLGMQELDPFPVALLRRLAEIQIAVVGLLLSHVDVVAQGLGHPLVLSPTISRQLDQ